MRVFLSSHGASLFGAERVLAGLARSFAARGHEVMLEIPHDGPLVVEAAQLEGVRVWCSGRARLPRNTSEAVRWAVDAPHATWRLAREIRRGRYDVVWANTLFNPLAALAGRLVDVPVVWHLHERNLPGPAGRLLGLLVRRLAAVPLTISQYMVERWNTDPGSVPGCLVLRNTELRGLTPLPPRPKGSPFTVGYLGQFEPRKRVDDILRALACIPEVRGLLVGHGKEWEASRAFASSLGLNGRVAFPGFQAEPAGSFADMDCVIFPAEHEPFGLVALEAVAVGRPVIAARSGALPEVLGDAALYYGVGDVDELVGRIRSLVADPVLRATLRARGFERLRFFTPERWAVDAEKVLHLAVQR
ncbi:MAG TPA: glycosyltransferase family 4 protein [Gemmatimonadaceae bacterium]